MVGPEGGNLVYLWKCCSHHPSFGAQRHSSWLMWACLGRWSLSLRSGMSLYELYSKLLETGYVGDHIGECYRG